MPEATPVNPSGAGFSAVDVIGRHRGGQPDGEDEQRPESTSDQ